MPHHLLTFISAGVSVIINSVLVFLLVRQKPARKANFYLAGWLIFLTFFVQGFGSLIISIKDPQKALFFYKASATFVGTFVFFWFFVDNFLGIKRKKLIVRLAWAYIAFLSLTFIIKPEILIKGVRWDEKSNFYLAIANAKGLIILLPLVLFVGDALYQLVAAYRHSRSPIERNRLKYLFLGGIFPYVGLILVAIPYTFFHRFPVDLWGATISSVFLSYAVLRYRLLDISVIIKKGLIYSVITAAITAIYLFFALSLQIALPGQTTTISIATILSTALVVSLIFQPLQAATQRFITRLFFKRDYDPKALINRLSAVFPKTIELKVLAKMVLEEICAALGIEKGAVFILDEKQQNLRAVIGKNISPEMRKQEIEFDSPLIKLFSQDSQPWLAITIKDRGAAMAKIEKTDPGLEVFIPLISQRKFLGFIALGNKTTGKIYNLEEINLLETVGQAISLALDNVLLFEELNQEKRVTEEAKANLEKRVAELERFKKSVIGREIKMIELKKELKGFKTKKETENASDE